jgi:hypothetical protein
MKAIPAPSTHPLAWGAAVSALALAGVALAPPALAQAPAEAQDSTVVVERPFVPGGQFDKPYLTTLRGRTAFGGYAEAHARFERVDGATEELGFEAKRFNLFAATSVSDFVRFGAELEFEEGGEEVKLEFATVDVAIHPALTLRAGMILSPLGSFNLAHDSPRNEFTDRPLVATDLIGVALSEPGLGVYGFVPLGADARVTYEAYLVNGYRDGLFTGSSEGIRIPLGRGNWEDQNRSPAMVGRVAFSPALSWEAGLSGHHGAWNVFEVDGLEVADREDLTILVGDVRGELVGVRLRAEGATASIDLPADAEGAYQSSQLGFFAEAMRDFGAGWVAVMPSSYFSAGVRVDAVDFDADRDGDSIRQLSVGLNFRPTEDTVLKLDYVRGRSFDAFENPSDNAGLLFSLATYF